MRFYDVSRLAERLYKENILSPDEYALIRALILEGGTFEGDQSQCPYDPRHKSIYRKSPFFKFFEDGDGISSLSKKINQLLFRLQSVGLIKITFDTNIATIDEDRKDAWLPGQGNQYFQYTMKVEVPEKPDFPESVLEWLNKE